VTAPTLLIVGSHDEPVIELNEEARAQMQAAHVELEIVPGATHLFEEPGTLEQVERLAGDWFVRHLR
jgi:pimeloyl-ACP methyl ester carboxylesterase